MLTVATKNPSQLPYTVTYTPAGEKTSKEEGLLTLSNHEMLFRGKETALPIPYKDIEGLWYNPFLGASSLTIKIEEGKFWISKDSDAPQKELQIPEALYIDVVCHMAKKM